MDPEGYKLQLKKLEQML